MAKTSVGLVLRSQAVEAVTLRRTFRGVALSRCARVHMAAEAPDQGESYDQRVIRAIREALAACQGQGKPVAVTVPARDVLLRCFTLPLLPKAEWELAVQFEARKYIPFKIEELIWDYHVIERRADKQLTVVFIGIRADALTRTQQWLREAGVEPTMVEAMSVSLARAASLGLHVKKDAFLALVDVEEDAAHITILNNQVPYLSRDVNLGVRGELPSGPDNQVQVDRRAELLVSELRLSLEYFTHEHPYASIGKVLLFGEEETIAPWCVWLSEQLRYPVELGTVSVHVPTGSPVAPLQFAAAVGLAMKNLRGADAKLDFLAKGKHTLRGQKAGAPSAVPRAEFLRAMRKPLAIQAGLAALCLLAVAWVGHRQVIAMNAALEQTIHMKPLVGGGLEGKTLEELQAFQKQLDTRLTALRLLLTQRVSVAEKLDALAKTVPEGVWLEGLRYENRLKNLESWQTSLALRGACLLPESERELEVIGAFAKRLKQDSSFFRGFASAQLGEIAAAEDPKQQYSYRTFRLNCQTQVF